MMCTMRTYRAAMTLTLAGGMLAWGGIENQPPDLPLPAHTRGVVRELAGTHADPSQFSSRKGQNSPPISQH
jgi:hypothetical protein